MEFIHVWHLTKGSRDFFILVSYKVRPLVQIYPPFPLTCFLCVADFQWLAKKVFFDGSLYFFVTYTMISPCATLIKRTTVLFNTGNLLKCIYIYMCVYVCLKKSISFNTKEKDGIINHSENRSFKCDLWGWY